MPHANPSLALEGGPKTITEPLPFAGFGAELIGEEEERYVLEALRGKNLCRITHPFADSFAHRFEEGIKRLTGAPFVHAVNSCASALHAAMVALDLGPGDEVLVSGAGWFATATAAINVGAVPVPVEYDESLTMDLDDLERKVNERTRAIIVVHWRGLPADMDRLMEIARKHDLRVVEDVAQSFGGTYRGRALGTIGDIGCYSFNMHKVITGGEGGALVMKEGPYYKRAVSFSGMYNLYLREYDDGERLSMPQIPMLNFRIPELCAAMAYAQLEKIDTILGTLRARMRELTQGLADCPGLKIAPRHDPAGECGYTLPLVFDDAESADFFFQAMRAEGATNASSLQFGFGGGEARGTAAMAASEKQDPSESGYMPLAHTWRCLVGQEGPTEKLNPWRLRGDAPPPALPDGVVPKTRERLRRVVALKTNVLFQERHTADVIRAARKVGEALERAR